MSSPQHRNRLAMTLQPYMKFLTRIRRMNKPRDNSANLVLNLSVDVVGLVVDHLGTFDRFRLSQTCRSMRNFFGGGDLWRKYLDQIQKHDPVAYAKFMDDMVFTSPKLWKCNECDQVHRVDRYISTPSNSPEGPKSTEDCRDPTPPSLTPGKGYKQMHIQLAVNLHRLNRLSKLDRSSQEYFKRLMAPLSKVYPSPDLQLTKWQSQARIINGSFYVASEYKFSAKWSRVPSSARMGRDFLHELFSDETYTVAMCGHLSMTKGIIESMEAKDALDLIYGTRSNTNLERTIDAVLSAGWMKSMVVCCQECPTDCEVECSGFLGRTLTIRAWKNLGTGEENDTLWAALSSGVMPPGLTYVPHKVGSIRQTWKKDSGKRR